MSNDDSLPKVLIVNDDASTLLALSGLLEDPLENPKYEVFTVQSGEEALRKVLKHNFAVILLDVSMPTMDGFETAEAIHSHPRSASVPIIFVTAYYGDEFNRLKGYQKGAADYLFAPIIPKVVQAKVAVFVELNQKILSLNVRPESLRQLTGIYAFKECKIWKVLTPRSNLKYKSVNWLKSARQNSQLATRSPDYIIAVRCWIV